MAAAVQIGRKKIAARRRVAAWQALSHCRLCAHECGVNRLAGEHGLCHAGTTTRVFSAQIEVADEMELVPTFAIALSGCDLRCAFCITGAQSWNARAGDILDVNQLAAQATAALRRGARTIMILGGEPTIHLPAVLDLVSALPEDAPLVWKTNAHASAEARALLSGVFDLWLADFKFGNNACAQRLAGVPNYLTVTRENLLWAAGETCLIVRHLVMPGHVECCWRPIAQWISEELPRVKVSLRDGYWPGWQSPRYPELNRVVSRAEISRATDIADALGLNLIE
jgi:putative pyruvate formate lyase activating enzyme